MLKRKIVLCCRQSSSRWMFQTVPVRPNFNRVASCSSFPSTLFFSLFLFTPILFTLDCRQQNETKLLDSSIDIAMCCYRATTRRLANPLQLRMDACAKLTSKIVFTRFSTAVKKKRKKEKEEMQKGENKQRVNGSLYTLLALLYWPVTRLYL